MQILSLRKKQALKHCRYNIFIACIICHEVYRKAYETVAKARLGIGEWIRFYNLERTHQSLGGQTPEHVYFTQPIKELAA